MPEELVGELHFESRRRAVMVIIRPRPTLSDIDLQLMRSFAGTRGARIIIVEKESDESQIVLKFLRNSRGRELHACLMDSAVSVTSQPQYRKMLLGSITPQASSQHLVPALA